MDNKVSAQHSQGMLTYCQNIMEQTRNCMAHMQGQAREASVRFVKESNYSPLLALSV